MSWNKAHDTDMEFNYLRFCHFVEHALMRLFADILLFSRIRAMVRDFASNRKDYFVAASNVRLQFPFCSNIDSISLSNMDVCAISNFRMQISVHALWLIHEPKNNGSRVDWKIVTFTQHSGINGKNEVMTSHTIAQTHTWQQQLY